jgi:hypothetical protein
VRGTRRWITAGLAAVAAIAAAVGLLLVRSRCVGDTSFDPHGPDAERSWSCEVLGGSHPTVTWFVLAAIVVSASWALVVAATRTARRRPLRAPVLLLVVLVTAGVLLVAGVQADVEFTGGI